MIYSSTEQQVNTYRSSQPFFRPAKRPATSSTSSKNGLSYSNRPSDTHLGSISQGFAVQDFCRSSTSSEASPLAHIDDGGFIAEGGTVGPAKTPEHAAGIARLINAWNPEMTLKRSNFKGSAMSRYNAEAGSQSRPRADSPSSFSSTRLTAKSLRQLSHTCSSCGERDTPQWRSGPSGIDTLCNFCGLMYAKRQKRVDRDHRSWKRGLKTGRSHV